MKGFFDFGYKYKGKPATAKLPENISKIRVLRLSGMREAL
jgi:hypothetical protein